MTRGAPAAFLPPLKRMLCGLCDAGASFRRRGRRLNLYSCILVACDPPVQQTPRRDFRMEKDTQVRHNFQASRRSLRASLYNWRHTSSVENKTSRCLRFGHNRYLYVLLTFDIWLDDRQRHTPDGGHEIAVRPQRRQP